MAVKVISDTTSYIEKEVQEELGIRLIPLSVHFPDESFPENEIDNAYFYGRVTREALFPTSSQPSMGELLLVFREIVEAGDAVVAIFISSEMSGTYLNATAALKELLVEYPDAQVAIVDSRTNCMSLGMQVLEAARAAKDDASFHDVVEVALKARDRVDFYFTPKTLEYLKKGGRIGTASALFGNMLNISPILKVDMDKGMTHLTARVRGSSRAVGKLYEVLDTDVSKHGVERIYVHHIDALDKAEEMQKYLNTQYPEIPVNICTIGPVIGLHVGPGTVGLAYTTSTAKNVIKDMYVRSQ